MTCDFQRSKAYRWEDPIHQGQPKVLPQQLQPIVDYVWAAAGLTHPPKVEVFKRRDAAPEADANRMRIRVRPSGVESTVLLHEIAHAMTPGYGHGPRWLGMYMLLLEKHCQMDMIKLMYTAKQAKLTWDFSGPDLDTHLEVGYV